ncbi:MAG: hypothetical protein ABW092_02490 [Candidatus Thiodiazotropha sp.]
MTKLGSGEKTMINESQGYKNNSVISFLTLMLLFLSSTVYAEEFNVTVVDQNGVNVSGFRWTLQEDTTYLVDPGSPSTNPNDLLSLSFHKSYHPTLQNGKEDGSTTTISNVEPNRRYYVSVLPYSGYSISGGSTSVILGVDPGDDITVVVQQHPIPTAQISIFLFHDNAPINGAPDLPEESDPGVGQPGHVDWTKFTLFLEEPGGRYGVAGGQVIKDAFDNPLGTTYREDCDINNNPVPVIDFDPFIHNHVCFVNGAPIVDVPGNGILHPDENGFLLAKNLAPGKYGIVILPPDSSDPGWHQTGTIEGTKVIDAWVKANEPAAFVEVGPPGPHAFIGFIKSSEDGGFPPLPAPDVNQITANVTGEVTGIHLSRPPFSQFFTSRPFPGCWIGLNDTNAGGGGGQGIYSAPCNEDSTFTIPNLREGTYQLVVFDANQDIIINLTPLTVDADGGCNGTGSCNLGNIDVFNWFARLDTGIFNDKNQNGVWEPDGADNIPGNEDDENGIGPESQDVSLRWRDGTIYQNFPTDGDGLAPFDEVFPFFHWLVAEVSFANKKATGATFVVDAGGALDHPDFEVTRPQPQCVDPSNYDIVSNSCVNGDPGIITNPVSNDNYSRTELGQVLTQGVQGFLGQTSIMHFGKTDYKIFTDADFTSFPPELPNFIGENGGISGIVFYATTRAEDDPQFAAAEEWEPGVPRVQLALYADGDIDSFPLGNFPNGNGTYGDVDWNHNNILEADDGRIDDVDGNGCISYADVNNYPFDDFPGPGDIDYAWADNTPDPVTGICAQTGTANGVFDLNDAVQVTWTDSWDDDTPTGCQGLNNVAGVSVISPEISDGRCFDGNRNWNQVRPAVFDGGYAFTDYDMTHLGAVNASAEAAVQAYYTAVAGLQNQDLDHAHLQLGMLPGDYIVQMAPPPGYENLREEHKNVDYGDQYIPSEMAFPATCVGEDHTVPPFLSMATTDGSGDSVSLIPGVEAIDAPFAGETRPLCDMKAVPLSSGQNAAAEFFLMTHVPKAGNISGTVLNDLANQFDPTSPAFGEKAALPGVPVAFYDWNDNELSRTYTDRNGRFNLLVPSTFTANLPIPSGMSPSMLVSCMNDAGPILNPDYDATTDPGNTGVDAAGNLKMIIDPYFDPQYSQFCYTFQYMPGTITYLDTPVVPVAAFASPGQFPVDCERPTSTPVIASVTRVAGGATDGPFVLAGQQIQINSMGSAVSVPNPEWDVDTLTSPKTITRDYSFSTGAMAYLEDASGSRTALTNASGDSAQITGTVPSGVFPGEYQVVVVNSDGSESPIGATLTVGVMVGSEERAPRANFTLPATITNTSAVWRVGPTEAFTTIQDAIGNLPDLDASPVAAGDLILVAPGVYNEMVVMWKPVKLQGWGTGAVTINARKSPNNKIVDWRDLTNRLVDDSHVDTLTGQLLAPFGFPGLADTYFPNEEGAGIFVLGKSSGPNRFRHARNQNARIDGFTIVGASSGGGVIANGYNPYLNISNNRITTNIGAIGGGIRIGHETLSHTIANENDPDYDPNDPNKAVGVLVYDDANNDLIKIHHNHVSKNGGLGGGGGGGIGIYTGADFYRIQKNWVCGNFNQGNGGGIGHMGLSKNGVIENNFVVFNETFLQAAGSAPAGGGIFIGGKPPLTPEATTGLLLSPGSGKVTVDSNLIRGNLAGAGDGGGIAIANANGHDIAQNVNARGNWYKLFMYNNMINNNVAGLAGGGVALTNSPNVDIRNNTVAHNDSTSTGSQAFINTNQTVPFPAGIISRVHGPDMGDLLTNWVGSGVFGSRPEGAVFSDPVLRDTIIYHNRSFFWTNYDSGVPTGNQLVPISCGTPNDPNNDPTCDITQVETDQVSFDLGVLNGTTITGNLLNPVRSLLLGPNTGYSTNNTFIDPNGPDPTIFTNGYLNTGRDLTLLFDEPGGLQVAAAADEGGNFIQVAFGPLSLVEPDITLPESQQPLFDYHLFGANPTSLNPAIDSGGVTPSTGRLSVDFDDDPRPGPANQSDIGADEYVVAP